MGLFSSKSNDSRSTEAIRQETREMSRIVQGMETGTGELPSRRDHIETIHSLIDQDLDELRRRSGSGGADCTAQQLRGI